VEPKTRLAGVHVLRKDGGTWKIFDTEVISTDVADPPPDKPETAEKNEKRLISVRQTWRRFSR